MPGLPELIIIALILLLMIAVPVAIIALVVFLISRTNSSRRVTKQQDP